MCRVSIAQGVRVRGTKLWQSAGSPIIQGRSRTDKPFWQDWLGAVVLATVLATAYEILVTGAFSSADAALREGALTAFQSVVVGVVPTAAAVWLSRQLRWGRPIPTGAILGAAVVIVYVAVTARP